MLNETISVIFKHRAYTSDKLFLKAFSNEGQGLFERNEGNFPLLHSV